MIQHKGKVPLGVIEGYYGQTWSMEDRCAHASFLSEHGFDFFVYAPKADPFLRKRWREPWPESTWDELLEVRQVFSAQSIEFGVGLSPFELYRDYSTEAQQLLRQKVHLLNRLEIDIICIFFDDMAGVIPQAGMIQSDIAHSVRDESTAKTCIVCPTYYSSDSVLDDVFGPRPIHYLETLGRQLDVDIQLCWSGPLVCSTEFPAEHMAWITSQFQRKPFLWDNYPVNDGAQKSKTLRIGAVTHCSEDFPQVLSGHMANPMNQPWLSQIPLKTLELFYQEPARYCSHYAFEVALQTFCSSCERALFSQYAADMQFRGLSVFSEEEQKNLMREFGKYLSPFSREVVCWLQGEYRFDPACLTD